MVLQAGRHEAPVRHAIAAIGALHEKLLTGAVNPGQSQDRQTRFALEQCNKSIQLLVKPNVSSYYYACLKKMDKGIGKHLYDLNRSEAVAEDAKSFGDLENIWDPFYLSVYARRIV